MCFIEKTKSALLCASPLDAVTISLSPYQTIPPRWEPSFAKFVPLSVGTTSSTQRYVRAPGSLASMKATRARALSSSGSEGYSSLRWSLCVQPDRITLLVPHTPSSSASPDEVTDCGSHCWVSASPSSKQYAEAACGLIGSAAFSEARHPEVVLVMGWLALFSTVSTPTLGRRESSSVMVDGDTVFSVSVSFAKSDEAVSCFRPPGLSATAACDAAPVNSVAPAATVAATAAGQATRRRNAP